MALQVTDNLNSIFATTLRNTKKELVDNIVVDSVFLAMMGQPALSKALRRDRTLETSVFGEGIKLEEDPGFQIQFPLMYKKNTTSQAYGQFDVLDTTPQDPFTVALYPWRSFAGTINLSNEDLDKNSGSRTKIIDFMESYKNNLTLSLSDDITNMLLGTRTAGSAETFGLLDIVKDDPTTNPNGGNVGGIDSTAGNQTWWRNYTANFASASFGTDQTGSGAAAIRKMIRKTTFGNKRPTVLMGGDSFYEQLLASMLNQNRFMNKGALALADAGFEALTFGNIPVVREPKIETVRTAAGLTGDACYALNLDYWKIFGMKRRWFEPSKMKEPYNQDTNVMHIITRLQLATNARRQNGVVFAFAAV